MNKQDAITMLQEIIRTAGEDDIEEVIFAVSSEKAENGITFIRDKTLVIEGYGTAVGEMAIEEACVDEYFDKVDLSPGEGEKDDEKNIQAFKDEKMKNVKNSVIVFLPEGCVSE